MSRGFKTVASVRTEYGLTKTQSPEEGDRRNDHWWSQHLRSGLRCVPFFAEKAVKPIGAVDSSACSLIGDVVSRRRASSHE